MKKIILYLFIIFTSVTWSQRSEKIRAYKTAYITEQVDLSPAEAEKFWPIYNKYERQLSEVRRTERREIFETVKGDLDVLTEEEAQSLVDNMQELKEQEHEYRKALMNELQQVLSAKKILKLKRAEEEFKRNLLKRFKNRRGGRP